MPTLRETAFHEAGHAVVAVYFGFEVIEATIIEADGKLGAVTQPALPYNDMPDWRSRTRLVRQDIVCSYSGIEAERLINPGADEDLASEDIAQAWNLPRKYPISLRGVRAIGDEAYVRFQDRLRKEAKRTVRMLRVPIAAVADELVKKRRLDGRAVCKIVGRWVPAIESAVPGH